MCQSFGSPPLPPRLIKTAAVPFWLKAQNGRRPHTLLLLPPAARSGEVTGEAAAAATAATGERNSGFSRPPPEAELGSADADVTGDKGLKLTPDKGVSKVINILVDGVEPYRRKPSGKGEACSSVETVNKAGNL